MSSCTTTVDALRFVGRKTLRKLQTRSNENLTAAPDSTSFGRKMMEKVGWTEGSGLGANQDGITTHIRAKKRGAEGLGSNNKNTNHEGDNAKSCLESGWYLKVFDDAKKNKKNKKSKKRKRDKNEKDDDDNKMPSIPTDAELLKATGGARLGRRAQPRGGEVGKMKRIAAADAAYMAKFGSGNTKKVASLKSNITSSSSSSGTTEPSSPKKKKIKKLKVDFRWKQVIRKQIEENDGKQLKLKKLKKNVVKLAQKSFPSKTKDELKVKFDSKWKKMAKDEKKKVIE